MVGDVTAVCGSGHVDEKILGWGVGKSDRKFFFIEQWWGREHLFQDVVGISETFGYSD
jgi:hypothetical protein